MVITRPIIIALLFVILLLGLTTYYAYSYAVDSPLRISSERAKYLLKRNEIDLILDVRTDFERSTLGIYPGSVHIQSADLEKRMGKLYPDKKIRILAYCNSGQRARMATEKLQQLGYTNSVYISSSHVSLMN
jgi:rhodanese-related sulfurtransferase